MPGKSWYKVPTKLLKMEIPTSAKMILVVLYDAERDAAGEVEITIEQLERRSGYSRRQIIRAVEILAELGLIIIQRTGRASRYIFPPDRLLPPKGTKKPPQKPEEQREAARYYLEERGYYYDDV